MKKFTFEANTTVLIFRANLNTAKVSDSGQLIKQKVGEGEYQYRKTILELGAVAYLKGQLIQSMIQKIENKRYNITTN